MIFSASNAFVLRNRKLRSWKRNSQAFIVNFRGIKSFFPSHTMDEIDLRQKFLLILIIFTVSRNALGYSEGEKNSIFR